MERPATHNLAPPSRAPRLRSLGVTPAAIALSGDVECFAGRSAARPCRARAVERRYWAVAARCSSWTKAGAYLTSRSRPLRTRKRKRHAMRRLLASPSCSEMSTAPFAIRWTDHASAKALLLHIPRTDVEDIVVEHHAERVSQPRCRRLEGRRPRPCRHQRTPRPRRCDDGPRHHSLAAALACAR